MDTLMVVLRVAVSLVVVLALVWYLARRLGRRGGDTTREAELRVLDRQSLTRRAGLAVVAAGDRRLLVGFSDQTVTLVTELAPVPALPKVPATPAPAAPAASAPSRPSRPSQPAVPTSVGLSANRQPGLLAGSVLSPATWQATVRAMQDRTVRR